MIEVAFSKNSQRILKRNGKLVCSSVDPQKEGHSWVQAQKLLIGNSKSILVFGVGCGFHLRSLASLYQGAKVIAIDIEKQFIDFAKREWPIELANIHFIHASQIQDLVSDREFKIALRNSYAVLKYTPAQFGFAENYQAMTDFASARSESGFCNLVFQRQYLSEILKMEKIREVNSDLVSIKTVEKILDRESQNDLALLFLALREMVA